jgi:hypothetical protein
MAERRKKKKKKKRVRLPGIEPGSKAWKASMLTITPQTPEWKATENSRHKALTLNSTLPGLGERILFVYKLF